MKVFFIFLTLALSISTIVFGQSDNTIELSTSFGLSIIEGHMGFVVDGVVTKRNKRTNIGLFFSSMSAHKEENPREEDFTRLSLISDDLREPTGYYARLTSRIIHILGFNFGYKIIDGSKVYIDFGGGPILAYYREKDLIIDRVRIPPYISSGQDRDFDYTYQLYKNIAYRLSDNLSIGLKTRFFSFHDHNLNFMISTTLSL